MQGRTSLDVVYSALRFVPRHEYPGIYKSFPVLLVYLWWTPLGFGSEKVPNLKAGVGDIMAPLTNQ